MDARDVELMMKGAELAFDLMDSYQRKRRQEMIDELRKQIDEAGDRFRKRYPDPSEDVGPV